jgi:hypothetical protein
MLKNRSLTGHRCARIGMLEDDMVSMMMHQWRCARVAKHCRLQFLRCLQPPSFC